MMLTINQIVSHILQRMGYKRLAGYVLTADSKEIDCYIGLIRSKFISDKSLVEFIDYFL
jgi:hypothetical protein